MALPTQILIGLLLGIATGLFFGEPMGALAVLGDAFLKLLQMTVLPYVVASLVAGLGRLDYQEAKRLALRGGGLLVVFWLVAFAFVVAMPLAFPDLETASFFSTTLVERRPAIDFVQLYIPSNPFYSMANNVVPAVVLFSIAIGVALIGIPAKEQLIRPLETLSDALHRVSNFVVRLTPAGVFAIGASAAGTMSVHEFERVQVYLLTYIAFALVLTLWIFPGLVAALTGIRHRDIVYLSRGALITAFATGSEFVVIPLLAEQSKELLQRHQREGADADSLVDVLIPVSYSFPHVAKVLSLSFIPFAAWFSGAELGFWDYPKLGVTGVVSVFGSINVAMPFLLNLMQIPEDMFRLFVATGVLNARFGTLLGAMHILTLTLLVACALTGHLKLRSGRLLRFGVTSLAIAAGLVVGARVVFGSWIDTTYRKDQVISEMRLVLGGEPAVVHREPPPAAPMSPDRSRLQEIVDRGSLRVCYEQRGALPFAFFNESDELVGLDVEMAHSLADGLGLVLEFVPVASSFGLSGRTEELNRGYCDITTRAALSMSNLTSVDHSIPYMEITVGFVLRDHRRSEFLDRHAVTQRNDLRLAMPNDPYYVDRMAGYFPNAELVPIDSSTQFLDAPEGEFDAMIFSAEAGSALSLLRPEFTVVVPEPPIQKIPLSYALPLGEIDWLNVVNSWIELKRGDGTVARLYDYWILGREAEKRRPRWSVIRDVLHWVD
jgi:Na+/H+-dicarboxylate symporter